MPVPQCRHRPNRRAEHPVAAIEMSGAHIAAMWFLALPSWGARDCSPALLCADALPLTASGKVASRSRARFWPTIPLREGLGAARHHQRARRTRSAAGGLHRTRRSRNGAPLIPAGSRCGGSIGTIDESSSACGGCGGNRPLIALARHAGCRAPSHSTAMRVVALRIAGRQQIEPAQLTRS